MIETLGQAREYGWKITARCIHGREFHEHPSCPFIQLAN
jgi:hypothetical protein